MDTRALLLEAALDLFSRKGYNGTGIQEIVDRANVGKPTLYYYFGSKEGVLEAIFAEYLVPFLTRIGSAAEYRGDITNNVSDIIRTAFHLAATEPGFYRLFVAMGVEAPDTVSNRMIRQYNEQLIQMLEGMFVAGAAQHGNMRSRERGYTLSLIGVINVYSLMIVNREMEVSDDLLYRVVHQFMHGIFS